MRTSLAQYDEIYEDASITYGSSQNHPDCLGGDHGGDKPVCVGVNTDPTSACNQAAKPLPVYSNGIVTLTSARVSFNIITLPHIIAITTVAIIDIHVVARPIPISFLFF